MKNFKISKKLKIVIIAICSLLIVSGIGFLTYPFFTNLFGNLSQDRMISEWEEVKKSLTSGSMSETSYNIEQSENSSNISIDNSDISIIETEQNDYLVPNDSIGKDYFKNLKVEDYFPLKINIPKIKIEWLVNEGTDLKTLKKGPGHVIQTNLPGQDGRCAISGHRTTYGAPFNQIDLLESGDFIYLETYNGLIFTYAVTEAIVVKPTDVYVLDGSTKSELVLTTCEPKFSAARRLVIIAELVEIIPLEMKLNL